MFIWIAIIIGTVLLDQLCKYLTVLYLKPVDTVPIIRDVLHLTYVENQGAAFGMMKNSRWIFMIISTVAIVGITVYMIVKKPTNRLERVALALIVGGGIGNMIDRILLGYVVDMIDFRLINFAVFNVADTFVCIGAGLLMLYLIRSMIQESKKAKAEEQRLLESDDAGEDVREMSGEIDKATLPGAGSEAASFADAASDEEDEHA